MSVALSGCGSVVKLPDAGTQFRDYVPPERSTAVHVELPPEPAVEQVGELVVLPDDELGALALFVETAYMLMDALHAREDQVVALEAEVRALAQAGAALEARLEVVNQIYENEVQSCRLVRLASYGAIGASFLILGAGAL